MLHSEKWMNAIEGACSVFFGPEDPKREEMRVILQALIEDIIRREKGLPSLSEENEQKRK